LGRRKKNNFISSVITLKASFFLELTMTRIYKKNRIKARDPRFFYLMLLPDYTPLALHLDRIQCSQNMFYTTNAAAN
jgi:hypothetical protein